LIVRESVFDCYVLTFDIASFLQTPLTRVHEWRVIMRTSAQEESDHWHCTLLRARRERPGKGGAPERSNEFPSSDVGCHSIRALQRSCPLQCGEEYHDPIGRSGPSVGHGIAAIRSLL